MDETPVIANLDMTHLDPSSPGASHPARHPLAGYSIASLLEGAAQLRPAALALHSAGEGQDITLASLLLQVEAQALRLYETGLNPGDTAALIAIPTPATIVSLIAACRLGLNLLLLPPAMARATRLETTGALGANAILSPETFAGIDLADEALASALANETVRLIAMTQGEAPDGAVTLADSATGTMTLALPREPRGVDMARLITFEMTPDGRAMPVVQEQATLIAAAMAFIEATRLGPGHRLVTCLPPASHAGLATGPVAMLLCGMGLHYVSEFSRQGLARAGRATPPATLLLPARVMAALAAEPEAAKGWQSLLALSRWPADASSYAPPHALTMPAPLADIHAFGERATVCIPRDAQGRAQALPQAPISIALNGARFTALSIGESATGTIALAGAAVSGLHQQGRATP